MIRFNLMATLFGLFIFVLSGLAAILPNNDQPKNLKVLPKNISSDSLFAIMKTFELSLGVKCGHCHVVNDLTGYENYASDSLAVKEQCRNMMRMTDSLNKNYFQKHGLVNITCFTCHRGKKEPVNNLFDGR